MSRCISVVPFVLNVVDKNTKLWFSMTAERIAAICSITILSITSCHKIRIHALAKTPAEDWVCFLLD